MARVNMSITVDGVPLLKIVIAAERVLQDLKSFCSTRNEATLTLVVPSRIRHAVSLNTDNLVFRFGVGFDAARWRWFTDPRSSCVRLEADRF